MTTDNAYTALLARKTKRVPMMGFAPPHLSSRLYPFQQAIVARALELGRSAVFADCGLGKTPVQLEWARRVMEHTNRHVLVLAPLAVSQQTIREGAKFGIAVDYAADGARVAAAGLPGIYVTNYERLEKFDHTAFGGVVLDESSILKAFMGKTRLALQAAFKATPYKLCCTATPAPNDHMELGNHSEFLGLLQGSEMLSRWFINDTSQFGSYRLKGHAVDAFWDWVASWAQCCSRPSDMGDYDDSAFELPELRVKLREAVTDLTADRGDALFRLPRLNATEIHRERRRTAPDRAACLAECIDAAPGESWVVWCESNYEADAIRAALPRAVDVRGNESLEAKEAKLAAFGDPANRGMVLVTKPKIAGFGLNWQHCARVAFMGPTFSYESYYQTIRRSWRFGQTRPVEVNVAMTASERGVWDILLRKTEDHRIMQRGMFAGMRRRQRKEASVRTYHDDAAVELPQWAGGVTVKAEDGAHGGDWTMIHGDSVAVVPQLAEGTIDLAVYSPPFANLYIYSDSERDMGNCADDDEFLEHYGMMVRELHRRMRPGRVCAVHCKDLVNYKNRDGMAGLRDFPGEIIRLHTAAGFAYHSRVTIWKDPVIEMQRTKAHGLLYKQLRADSSFSRQGLAEYLLVFRRWAASEEEDALVRPVGQTFEGFPLEQWQRWASPVWEDIDQTNVLNTREARDDQDEKHICPLQLDVIERAVRLWSNPGDLVFSPFAGIGSEGWMSTKLGRKFLGIELKARYFEQACRNLRDCKAQLEMFA